jgi:subtilase family serine protease
MQEGRMRHSTGPQSRHRALRPSLDQLEGRQLLSWSTIPFALSPQQIQTAYSFDSSVAGKPAGTGQAIAVMVSGIDPTIRQDLHAFDVQYGLSDPALSVWTLTADGDPVQTDVGNPTNISNAFETSLDVEWAHACAPGATIYLVQTGPYVRDILDGMAWAAEALPVSVVTTSFGYNGPESQALEQAYDHNFAQPANGQHVAFVAAAGDYGSGNTDYPSWSPEVLSVGGTTLTLGPNNSYGPEVVWNQLGQYGNPQFGATGGGVSLYEPIPSYQVGKVNGISATHRVTTDVSFDAGNGVSVYDSTDDPSAPWNSAVGTSVGAPCWAGIVATLDQALASEGFAALTSDQLHSDLYSLEGSTAFHDITQGSNGTYSALNGYDVPTGLGSPIVNNLVQDIAPTVGANVQTSHVAGSGSAYTLAAAPVASSTATDGYFTHAGIHEGHANTLSSNFMRSFRYMEHCRQS